MADKLPPSQPNKRNFADDFFPARPAELIRQTRKMARRHLAAVAKLGTANAQNKTYLSWLKRHSMLYNATTLGQQYSGNARQWQNPFAKPRPRAAVEKASVWYTSYPISMIGAPGETMLETIGQDDLWKAFQEIGIKGLHTGPVKSAGGLNGWLETPSIDGHFDRVSNSIDPVFGDEDQFRAMSLVANDHDGIIIDDIVPGHTGKGADFRLAEMGYGAYPGLYHMVEISQSDWKLLPDVPPGHDSANLDQETEEVLKRHGYIIGRLQRVIFYEPGVKDTNWSATKVVKGVDGVNRRWVYLHYFKEGQPSLNWLDPSFSAMQLVVGDALHSIGQLQSSGLRLDANGFLGIERSGDDTPAWSEGHPLSAAANQLVSGMVRKVGGFTFQELNLSIDDIKSMSSEGADLSYDFINRPAYQHALATSDTEFLRMTLRLAHKHAVDPASLVHALQNHDEMAFELVHFWTAHKDDIYKYHGKKLTGLQLRDRIRADLTKALTGKNAPYNLPFTENGIACTTTSVVAASLGYKSLDNLGPDDISRIRRAHLLLAMFNALQPGVFALSGWDLTGALTIDPKSVAELIKDGDTRWINRGAYDLMSSQPEAIASAAGIPRARVLYGSLPDQLKDPDSFACQLKRMLAIREQYHIATSYQVDIPEVDNPGVLVMIHQLLDSADLQVTVLNFSGKAIKTTVESDSLPGKSTVMDMLSEELLGEIGKSGNVVVSLEPYEGRSLLVSPREAKTGKR